MTDKPQNAALTGIVRLAESSELLVGASIAVIAAPNDQRGPILTDQDGCYSFDKLPATDVLVVASGPSLARRQLHVGLQENATTTLDIELKSASERKGLIQVRGLQVTIAEEATFIVAGMDEPMTLEAYVDYTRQEITRRYPDWQDFASAWQDPWQRQEVVEQLDKASVRPDVLAEVLEEPEVDEFDLLAYLAYGRALRTRRERVRAFQKQEVAWLSAYPKPAQEVILALLRKYELGGLRQITDPNIFRVSPFREMGELRGVIKRFGSDSGHLRSTIDEIQQRLYTV
ncbi:MAG: carboxypeptidase regulatory-like domain-containing protein [Anaerolineales bacterium]|nr:carboxypeptidase regulatory-like domain-containing protein [Anaerolineales bacterium]